MKQFKLCATLQFYDTFQEFLQEHSFGMGDLFLINQSLQSRLHARYWSPAHMALASPRRIGWTAYARTSPGIPVESSPLAGGLLWTSPRC